MQQFNNLQKIFIYWSELTKHSMEIALVLHSDLPCGVFSVQISQMLLGDADCTLDVLNEDSVVLMEIYR